MRLLLVVLLAFCAAGPGLANTVPEEESSRWEGDGGSWEEYEGSCLDVKETCDEDDDCCSGCCSDGECSSEHECVDQTPISTSSPQIPPQHPSCVNFRCPRGQTCTVPLVICPAIFPRPAYCDPPPRCEPNPCASPSACPSGTTCIPTRIESCASPTCNLTAECVPSCRKVACQQGHHCELKPRDTPCRVVRCGPKCYPDLPKCVKNPDCDSVKCPSDSRCVMSPVRCHRENCPSVPRCVPSCKAHKCPDGQACVLGPDLRPSCRRYLSPCGVVRCAAGTQCEVALACTDERCTARGECKPAPRYCDQGCAAGWYCLGSFVRCPPGGCPRRICAKKPTCEVNSCKSDEGCILENVPCPMDTACFPKPKCINKRDPCSSVKCHEGYSCLIERGKCADYGERIDICRPQPICALEDDPCVGMECEGGKVCRHRRLNQSKRIVGECVQNPCDAAKPPAGSYCLVKEQDIGGSCYTRPCHLVAKFVKLPSCEGVRCHYPQECVIRPKRCAYPECPMEAACADLVT